MHSESISSLGGDLCDFASGLLGTLAQLREMLTREVTSIDALIARILVRRGLIAEAFLRGAHEVADPELVERVRGALHEQELARTIAAVAPLRELASTLDAGDLAAQLAMLEVVARAEPHDVVGARDLVDRIVQPEVVVDVAHATITTRRAVVKRRAIACGLLACLADARGEVVPPDVLYRAAWEATEYHPLRDRNRLYVAVKRLRTTLTELCGDDRGELIETRSGGWRLVAGVVVRRTR